MAWWESLTEQERADVLALPPGPMPDWVLDTMERAGIPLSQATIGGEVVRLPPTITSDFIARRKAESPPSV